MSSTALSTKVLSGALPLKHVVVPLPVYAASTPYIVPVISGHVTPIAAAVIGLVPIFPVIADEGPSVIPAFVRITKFPAVPRSTGARPAATAPIFSQKPSAAERAVLNAR